MTVRWLCYRSVVASVGWSGVCLPMSANSAWEWPMTPFVAELRDVFGRSLGALSLVSERVGFELATSHASGSCGAPSVDR